MEEHFVSALSLIERAFRRLESQLAPPIAVPFGRTGFVYRYAERGIQQALIQNSLAL
jgi:hypothetical protein